VYIHIYNNWLYLPGVDLDFGKPISSDLKSTKKFINEQHTFYSVKIFDVVQLIKYTFNSVVFILLNLLVNKKKKKTK